MKDQTIAEFVQKFDNYRRTADGNVIIHPGLPYSLIELKEEFVQQLKKEIATSLVFADAGMDELNAVTKFAIMMLDESY